MGRPRRAARHPLARHVDDFLTDLANANKPRNTIRAYRGDLIAFAATPGRSPSHGIFGPRRQVVEPAVLSARGKLDRPYLRASGCRAR